MQKSIAFHIFLFSSGHETWQEGLHRGQKEHETNAHYEIDDLR